MKEYSETEALTVLGLGILENLSRKIIKDGCDDNALRRKIHDAETALLALRVALMEKRINDQVKR